MVTPKKVLVVDDSDLIHNMYRLMFKKYPNCVQLRAANGKEALDKLTLEKDIDLILLDINMPVMNGIQFLENFRQIGTYSHIPIIVISTEGKEEDTLKALSLGAKGYVVKPFKSHRLHSLIEQVLNNGNGSGQAE